MPGVFFRDHAWCVRLHEGIRKNAPDQAGGNAPVCCKSGNPAFAARLQEAERMTGKGLAWSGLINLTTGSVS